MDNTELSFISRKQRQVNMTNILNSIKPDEHNFNTMILGFSDIIQSAFFDHLNALCKTEKEKEELRDRINGTVNAVMDILNHRSLTNPEDMVVMSTVMIECINKALFRAKEEKLPINHTIEPSSR